ncbi:Opr family porin [Poseidonibacter antarcticus]|uniref:Opr family porin n=1 Tax=Poseidonibacter antarcticus TaxID=2478538 RepID=UPI000EF44812|nr:Opr family porin [Poseidonibacter antarcticus]
MKKQLSLITSGLILSSSLAFGANSFEEALKSGTVNGSLEMYGIKTDNKGGNKDTGFISGTVGLSYETDSFKGFSAKVGFIGAHVFDDKNDGAEEVEGKALMNVANIKYETEGFLIKAGRQNVNLEWMTDYHEAVIAEITSIPNTSILLGYSDKIALADADELSETFEEVNGSKGIYVADVIYQGISDLDLNPYYYTAPDMGDLYGMKVAYYFDDVELSAQYAKSKEDTASGYKDGSIAHVNIDTSLMGVNLSAGYVKTDKDGTGSIISELELGDNISPFEDGNYIYDEDARTVYGSASYSIDDIAFGALYGETKYADEKEKELNLSAEIEIVEDVIELEALFVKVDAQNSDDDYNKFILEVEYSF